MHDLLVTLAFLAFFQYDITLNVIAAILTVTGYSTNDTIVIFDRVRENLKGMRRDSLHHVINVALNQTLSRTIITAGTALMSALALFIFGGEVLRGFAFTMMVGIITGTYSSIFVAAAIVTIWRGKSPTRAASHAPASVGAVRHRAAATDPQVEAAAESARLLKHAVVGVRRSLTASRTLMPDCRMPTLVQAALLGILQGLTEFLPISSTAHLLDWQPRARVRRSGRCVHGDDSVRFGSGRDVVVSRSNRASGAWGWALLDAERHFAVAVFLAFVPAAIAGAFLSDFVKRVLYESFATIAVAFIVGGVVMLVVERLRPQRRGAGGGADSGGQGGVGRRVPDAGAGSRGVAIRRHDRRRAADGARSAGGGRVLVFSGDADDGGGISPRFARGPAASCRRIGPLEIGVGFVMAFLASLVVVKPFLNLVARSGFAPFAWYRIAAGVGLLAAIAAGWL